MRCQSIIALLFGLQTSSEALATAQAPALSSAAEVQTSSGFGVASATKSVQVGDLASLDQSALEELKQVVKAADLNQDGKLCWDEVLRHAHSERQVEIDTAQQHGEDAMVEELQWDADSENNLKASFRHADANNDGFLTMEELPAMVQEEDQLAELETEEHNEDSDQEEAEHQEDESEEEHSEEHHEAEADEQDEEKEDEKDEKDDTDEVELDEEEPQAASLMEMEVEEHDEHEQAQGDSDEDMTAFIRLTDTDKDGKLSLKEVKAHLETPEGAEMAAKIKSGQTTIEAEFKSGDTNKDGFLDKEELMHLYTEDDDESSLLQGEGEGDDKEGDSEVEDLSDESLKETFKTLDGDRDGKLSWADINAGIKTAKQMKQMPDYIKVEHLKTDFGAADSDNDGLLSFEDFRELARAEVRRSGKPFRMAKFLRSIAEGFEA